ncbi:nucleoside triphosphate pyrophosphohydrolase [Moritella viscosa]|uniref:MazG family protein n=1 Tax=Moritella viscosa TaxID=80854 RepID=A0ABY1H723_9GAMM|nr:nucleoside triphosphate pyrophosphohydrolase [Moritella viscosa]SGY81944.1 MazG family protein [Moritella viscosa]SGY82152.1 MazG family protein [Moritella viscosa]SGY82160.1 MazG family protein [Moritella viscosa]SGY82434.1 MazG family protein [Moritella viscosa]SHO24112.1 MazG family protein [Moritella viscosa]
MKEKYTINDLQHMVEQLRNPDTGCPWNLQQDFASIAKFTLEEAYEVVDAIENNDVKGLEGEVGDLLYHVLYYTQLGHEQALFSFDSVIQQLAEKLTQRHPYVFGEIKLQHESEVIAAWQKQKSKERVENHEESDQHSALDNIPNAFPALVRATKIQQRAADVKFDFESYKQALSKVYEEIGEVVEEADARVVDQAKLEEELGDLLFSVVNVTRHLKHDPEQALRKANEKFEKRFRQVEVLALQNGKSLSDCSIGEMESLWLKVK